MSLFFGAAREAQTTLPCPHCEKPLHIKRSCHEAFMVCNICHKKFALEPFIPKMDDAMEAFLENLYTNRI